ncbi:MAG: XdhC family protein, partial [Planctomycetia bacterium]
MHAQTWIETLNRLRAAERPCAMVVVTELAGSGPREPGARMIVALRSEGGVELIEGTIGGGRLELSAMEHAAE